MKTTLSPCCLLQLNRVLAPGWRRICATLFIVLSLPAVTFAQNKVWDKTIGGKADDQLTSVQQTSDGGYILGGSSKSGINGDKTTDVEGRSDYWVVKLNADGSKAWDKTFGGKADDLLASVQQTSDGGYILGGSSSSGSSGDKTEASKGRSDYWIVKLKADGSKAWDKTFGGNKDDNLASLQQTSDGGYILGGYSYSNNSSDKSEPSKGGSDYWVVKLKADGTKVWDKTLGGDSSDRLTSLQQTTDSGYILGGSSESGISGDKTEGAKGGRYTSDYWIIKLKADGSKVWDKTFGGSNNDALTALQQTSDGGYILGGYSDSGISGDKTEDRKGGINGGNNLTNDYWVVKVDAAGTKVWDKAIGGEDDDFLQALQQTSDGGYIVGGYSISGISGDKAEESRDTNTDYLNTNDYWVVKLRPDGTIAWDKTIGGDALDELKSLQQTSDGSYILGGSSKSNSSSDKTQANRGGVCTLNCTTDYWLVKLDNSGTNLNQTITWVPISNRTRTYGDAPFALSAQASSGLPVSFTVVSGPATIKGNIITLTGVGTVTVKATQAGNATYKPAPAVTQTFLVEAGTLVKKQWEKAYGGIGLTSLQPTSDGSYILGGYSSAGSSSDKSEASRGGNDYWIIKINAAGTKVWDKTFGGSEDDKLTSLQQTSDGGYLLGGTSESGKSGDKTEANKDSRGKDEFDRITTDYWIVKVNAAGAKEWDKTFGGEDFDGLSSLQQTSDGGYILGGYSTSGINGDKTQPSKGGGDYWIVKLKADGTKVWDKTIGGNGNDILSSLRQTSESGFILGGYSESGISGDKTEASKGNYDYWVVKLNADGTKAWDKTNGADNDDYLQSLQQTSDGGYILGGTSYSGKNGDKSQANYEPCDGFDCTGDYWAVKLNADGTKIWDKTIGGDNYDLLAAVQLTRDGGYILGGSSLSGISGDKTQANRGGKNEYGEFDSDYWVVKLNADGSKAWDKTIGGDKGDELAAVQLAPDGGYILGGTSGSGISGDKTEVKTGYWVVKLQDETSPLTAAWDMRYGGAGNDNFTVAIKTTDGGYLSGGYTNSGVSGDKTQSSQGQNDYWIVKSDKNGTKLWDKRYGGSADDYLNRVIQTADGGYLLGGSSLSGIGGDKTGASRGDRDYWVIKVDAQGNKQWDKRFGGTSYDELKKVIQLASGEYVLGGYSNSPVSGDKTQASQGGNDYWLVKISSTGTKLWDQCYGGSSNETLGSFTETRDGGFLLGGTSFSKSGGDKTQANRGGSDYWVVKTDKDGNLLWDKTYGGTGQDEAYSVGHSGNNFFISGTSNSGISGEKSQNSQGGKDYWLIKISSTGTKLWDKRFGGNANDELRASTAGLDGGYVLAGSSFSGASGDKSQSNQGGSDYWLVQVNAAGNKISDQRYGGSGTEELRTVFKTADGGLLLGGRSDSGVSGDRSQPSLGGTDYWLVKVAPVTSSMLAAREATLVEEPASVESVNLSAYPNPFAERATIRFTLPETQTATVKVYDSQGREVATLFQGEAQAQQTYQLEWKASHQTAGIYLLQLQTPTKRSQHKLLLNK